MISRISTALSRMRNAAVSSVTTISSPALADVDGSLAGSVVNVLNDRPERIRNLNNRGTVEIVGAAAP
jgi:hypothetical protein